jgi:adenylosuccinate lyase
VQRLCDHGWGEYIHYGATTQDIIDTGMMLGVKETYAIVQRDLEEVESALLDLVERNASVVMVGRTHGQQALPITFGYKAAVWLREISRHIERWMTSQPRVLVGVLAGGVGTYSGFGALGFEIERRVMEKLGLGQSDIAWHTARDRFAEFVCLEAMIAGTLGKIGNMIAEMQKPEFGEISEPYKMGMVGSSTMPHKRNPDRSEALNGLSKLIRSRAAVMLESIVAEHERDGMSWKPEWVTIPEASLYLSASLDKAKAILKGLQVHPERMQANLQLLKGLILSEAAMFAIGQRVGKQTAHEVVYEAAARVYSEGISFKECLLTAPQLHGEFTEQELDTLLQPDKYIGLSVEIAKRAVDRTRSERAARHPV